MRVECQRLEGKGGMHWARLVAIIVGAGVVSSLTDWFFAGDWIHRRYTYPEIWRQGEESRAIVLTSPLPFLTCGAFAFVASSGTGSKFSFRSLQRQEHGARCTYRDVRPKRKPL